MQRKKMPRLQTSLMILNTDSQNGRQYLQDGVVSAAGLPIISNGTAPMLIVVQHRTVGLPLRLHQ